MEISKDLISKCCGDNRRAHNELYKQLFSYVMSICLRYTKNQQDAGNALNEVMFKVITNLKKYDTSKPFLPWVKTITIHQLIDLNRKQTKYEEVQYAPEHENVAFSFNLSDIEFRDILKLVAELPEATAQVFNLYIIDGYNHKEIGAMLNLSQGTSKWHLHKAREILKVKLQHENRKAGQI